MWVKALGTSLPTEAVIAVREGLLVKRVERMPRILELVGVAGLWLSPPP